MKPIKQEVLTLTITGKSPMVQHKWDEKAKRQMREKHAGNKTRNRDVRDPVAECEAATYVTAEGDYGVPAMAIKKAVITAAHKDIGVEKTLIRKALFLRCDDAEGCLPMTDFSDPIMREDVVRVGQGSTDLRYRPHFDRWSVQVTFEYDAELLSPEIIVNLINRAGFGVGIGEMRPEKDGENGRFEVDEAAGVMHGDPREAKAA